MSEYSEGGLTRTSKTPLHDQDEQVDLDDFLTEDEATQEMRRLLGRVESVRRKYSLKIPPPDPALLLVIYRAVDPTPFLNPNQRTNPMHPGNIANWFGIAESIYRFGLIGLDANLNTHARQSLPGPVRGKTVTFNELKVRAGIIDIPVDDLKEMLKRIKLSNAEADKMRRGGRQRDVAKIEWRRSNLEVRIALLWSGLIAQEDLGQSDLGPIQFDAKYRPINDSRRLALSARAIELYERGDLDVVFPPGYDVRTDRDNSAKQQELLATNPPEDEWVRTLEELLIAKDDELQAATSRLRAKYPTIPFPKGVWFVPVRYGTNGSFSNQVASLIDGITFRPYTHNDKRNVLSSSYEQASNVAKTPQDARQFFGQVTDTYSAMESYYRYPFLIYVRMPHSVEELRTFIKSSFIPMCIEEYIHTSVYVFSTFYQLPHAMEEYLVHEILRAEGYTHSGTPTELGKVLKPELSEAYQKLVGWLIDKEISLGAFIEQASVLFHQKKFYKIMRETSTPLHPEEMLQPIIDGSM